MIAAIIQFLKYRLSACRVWYGSDSGEQPLEMTQEAMEKLWRYWSINGCRPYDERSRLLPRKGLPNCGSCKDATEFLTFGEAGAILAFCSSCGQIQAREEGQKTWRKIEPWGSL